MPDCSVRAQAPGSEPPDTPAHAAVQVADRGAHLSWAERVALTGVGVWVPMVEGTASTAWLSQRELVSANTCPPPVPARGTP